MKEGLILQHRLIYFYKWLEDNAIFFLKYLFQIITINYIYFMKFLKNIKFFPHKDFCGYLSKKKVVKLQMKWLI